MMAMMAMMAIMVMMALMMMMVMRARPKDSNGWTWLCSCHVAAVQPFKSSR